MSRNTKIILVAFVIMSLILGTLAGIFYSRAEDRLGTIHRLQERALHWMHEGLAAFKEGIKGTTNDSLSNAERLMWANFACIGSAYVDSSADEILTTLDNTSDEYQGFDAIRSTIWITFGKFLSWYKYPLDQNVSSGYPFTSNSTVDQVFMSILDSIEALRLEILPSTIDEVDFEAINAYSVEIRQVIDSLGYPETDFG